jgi:hypothetical protein
MHSRTGRKTLAARLLAEDRLTDALIAEIVGVSRATLSTWKHDPAFKAQIERYCTMLQKEIAISAINWTKEPRRRRAPPPEEGHKRQERKARQYGLSHEGLEALLQRQNSRCAICARPFTRITYVIDHDHRTGAVRGLLCSNCNTGLGMFADDRRNLQAAIEYLS